MGCRFAGGVTCRRRRWWRSTHRVPTADPTIPLSMRMSSKAACMVLLLITALTPGTQGAGRTSRSAAELNSVAELARRVVPWMADKLLLIHIPKERGQDVFDLRT